jgi:hypothetical protein
LKSSLPIAEIHQTNKSDDWNEASKKSLKALDFIGVLSDAVN